MWGGGMYAVLTRATSESLKSATINKSLFAPSAWRRRPLTCEDDTRSHTVKEGETSAAHRCQTGGSPAACRATVLRQQPTEEETPC